jgi:ABC-2 type transport system permease protein
VDIGKVWALTKRDIYDWSSYKTQVVITLLSAGVGIASWGFNASFRNVYVPEYNCYYVSYLVTGILIAGVIAGLSQGLDRRLKPWTLETILMSGISTPTFVAGTVAWSYLLAIILFIPQLFLGVAIFGVTLIVNPISLIVGISISSAIIFSLSMIAIGMRLVTKVNDPLTWTITMAAQLFSGMTFPVQYLNNYLPGLSNVSYFLPQTWVYDIIRRASLEGASLTDPSTAQAFLAATLIALVLVPLSLQVFRWGFRRAKRDGTLGWY